MNPKINNPYDPPTPEAQPTPVIDVSKLFQKDPVPVDTSFRAKLSARLNKNNIMIATVLLTGFLMGGGLIFAGLSPVADETWSQDFAEQNDGSPADGTGTASDETAQATAGEPGSDLASEFGEGPTEVVDEGIYTAEEDPVVTPAPEDNVIIADPVTHEVGYTNACYSPAALTIKKNEVVIFTNNSSGTMWPASNAHPSHSLYPEFDATGVVDPGDTYAFVFDKVGTWGYHDHVKLSCTGTITVR